MSAAQQSLSWKKRSPAKVISLRELLSDGRKHSQHEMQEVGGMRFGARLFDLHNETDFAAGVGPLHYRKIRQASDDAKVFYQVTDKATCDICTREASEKPAQRIARLEAENQALREVIARLRGDA